ncbi:uncharacterized protein LOC144166631 [Haemaphysalis longicornis]
MERLRAKRAARRVQVIKVLTEATGLIESGCSERTSNRKVVDKLVAIHEELRKINAKLEDVIPVEELERDYESVAHYNDHKLQALSRFTYRLEERSVRSTAQPAPPAAISTPQAPTMVPSRVSGPRLPMLTIKPFHGDVCSWTSFWEQFNGAVHTNQALTATDKFHYLRSYLSGEAGAAIAGLPTTEACYEGAVHLLNGRRELRRLYDSVQLNIRCLNVLNVPTSSFSAVLCDILLEVLPEDRRSVSPTHPPRREINCHGAYCFRGRKRNELRAGTGATFVCSKYLGLLDQRHLFGNCNKGPGEETIVGLSSREDQTALTAFIKRNLERRCKGRQQAPDKDST